MRKFLTYVLIFFAFSASAQSKKVQQAVDDLRSQYEINEYGQATITEIVEVLGATKEELFDRAINQLSQLYENPERVIKQKDKEQGKILVRGGFEVSAGMYGYVNAMHQLDIDFKEGKARIIYTFTDFTSYNNSRAMESSFNKVWPLGKGGNSITYSKGASGEVFLGTFDKAKTLIASMRTAISKNTADNW
jgi:hypothetical protein